MSILLVGDIHGGVRDGNSAVMSHQLDILDDLIEYCLVNNITRIVQLGDLWEVRRATNNNVADIWKTKFYEKLRYYGIEMDTLVGNHDAYFKNRIKPNFTNTLLSEFDNIHIHQDPTTIVIDGVKIGMVPWICEDNYDACMEYMSTADVDILCGHFEIKGARMESGVCEEGIEMEFFKRFSKVVSGHFHCRGEYGNIEYTGTPFDTTWADYGDDKGFGVYNPETNKIKYINTDKKLHVKIMYNENMNMDSWVEGDKLKNKYVKVVIEEREDFKKYEKWLMRLESKGAIDLKIIEPMMSRTESDSELIVDVENIDSKNTGELFLEYINDVYPDRKSKLSSLVLGLHAEARVS